MFRTQCVLALVALYVGLAQTWDIAVTTRDHLEFYTEDGIKTDTVFFDSQNLTAIAYDEVHNMLLYVDKQRESDAICGYYISSVEYKCYIERSGRDVQGLAFDPITGILFFTDTKEKSINWISINTETENNVNGNLLIKMADGVPTDIAVDSCKGYIYWVNTNLTTSTIERARFNGSEREVFIDASYDLNLHGLAIDQQTQKIYWLMLETKQDFLNLYSADISGKNKKPIVSLFYYADYYKDKKFSPPNELTFSKDFLFMLQWCSSCSTQSVFKFHKLGIETTAYHYFIIQSFVGIVAKNKIREQIQREQDCKGQTSLVPNNSYLKTLMNNNTFKIAKEYVEPFCDHCIKVNGQSHFKCTPGYIGKRCHISVCENYCLQGNCTLNEEGLPKCRCNAGYSGERCDVNACHGYCLNNGTCSLNEDSEPVCQCIGDYLGRDRCDVSDCLNYCLQGDCSFNAEGVRECRCNAGYSGERCEVNVCHGYCLNDGTCSLNEENEPVCQCTDNYAGDRCDVPTEPV